MKIAFLLIHPALLLLPVLQARPATPAGFELIKQHGTIFLYERWVTPKEGEKVRELKTILTINSNIPAIVHLLTDDSRGTAWNTHAVAYKVAPGRGRNDRIIYIRYGMPWPFSDQDCCLFYHLRLQTGAKTILAFQSTEDPRFPQTARADRMTGIRGEWILERLDDGRVKVTYTITTDRNKKIPRWVSDPVIHNNLFSTMASFKRLAEEAG